MATVVVKLEPLDDPSDVPLNFTSDYNIVDIKTEELGSRQSPDAGNHQEIDVKEEVNVESKQEMHPLPQRESQEDPSQEETQGATKRPRLSVNEESLLRTSNNSALTINAGSGCRHIPNTIDRSRRLRSSFAQDLPREGGNRSSAPSAQEHRQEENREESYEQRNGNDTCITSRSEQTNRSEPITTNTSSDSDSLKIFFDAMYHDTKALPLHLQIRTKRILFQAVADGQDMAGMSRPPMEQEDHIPSCTSRRVSSSGQMNDFNMCR